MGKNEAGKFPRLISLREISERTGLTQVQLRKAISRGDLAAFEISGRFMIDEAEVVRWLETKRVNVSESAE